MGPVKRLRASTRGFPFEFVDSSDAELGKLGPPAPRLRNSSIKQLAQSQEEQPAEPTTEGEGDGERDCASPLPRASPSPPSLNSSSRDVRTAPATATERPPLDSPGPAATTPDPPPHDDDDANNATRSPGVFPKKKRAKRRECTLPHEDELALVDWLREHPCLWDSKLSDYRITEKKARIWQEISDELGYSIEHLKIWFKGRRDIFTKLDKGKTGYRGVLTEREEWIKDAFSFLRKTVRHRLAYKLKRNELAMQQAEKDGDTCEVDESFAVQGWSLCDEEDLSDTDADSVPSAGAAAGAGGGSSRDRGHQKPSPLPSVSRESEEALRFIQQQIAESRPSLEAVKSTGIPVPVPVPPPVTSRMAFANYVRDSLLSMSNRNFKMARREINRFLTTLIEEDEDDNDIVYALAV